MRRFVGLLSRKTGLRPGALLESANTSRGRSPSVQGVGRFPLNRPAVLTNHASWKSCSRRGPCSEIREHERLARDQGYFKTRLLDADGIAQLRRVVERVFASVNAPFEWAMGTFQFTGIHSNLEFIDRLTRV